MQQVVSLQANLEQESAKVKFSSDFDGGYDGDGDFRVQNVALEQNQRELESLLTEQMTVVQSFEAENKTLNSMDDVGDGDDDC